MTRVLLIAEAANPEWVSVPLIGWSLSQALREVADVHLVTQVRNRDAILRAGLVEGEDFTVIDSDAVAWPLWKLGTLLRMGKGKGWTMVTALNALAYPYFEHVVWRRFGDEIKAGKYDVVHRVTPLTPTAVSSLAAKCARAGVPFVVGPLNGGVPWPKGFDSERRKEREWLSYVRGVYRLMPGRARMYRNTAAALVGSRHTESEVIGMAGDKTIYIPENAIDPARFNVVAKQQAEGPLRAAFVGRLVPYKGVDMLLEAAGDLLRDGRMELDVIGDGPMREALEAQAEWLPGVTFHGMLPHEEVQAVLAQAHIMSFPSIREFGGGVVLEAMALGVVPMVVDYAGPGELVDDSTGYAVPIGPRAEIIAGFRNHLSALAEDRTPLLSLSQAGRARVESHFTWPARARQIAQVWDWVCGNREDKPQLF